jgi:arabinogalactan endo-1,4-beta-galactosidase
MKLVTIACLLAWAGLLCILTATSCSKTTAKTSPTTDSVNSGTSSTADSTPSSSFAYGSDVSWVTEMEDSGYLFYNNSGVQQNLFTILSGKGVNAIRLRVWVNPAGGWCNTTDVVNKALSAKAAGMSILIDFHYSDTWADPGAQTVPAAWANQTFTQLVATVNSYTQGVLDTLQQNGITPTWVQVGNETNNGMLWPDGEASTNMQQYAALVTSGYNATKTVFP